MAQLHLIVGPVGAGKSTFANQLAAEHRAVRMNLDQWMAQLFSADRQSGTTMDWYFDRTERCMEQIWHLTESLIDVGTSVVLEIGLIRKHERERLYQRVDTNGYDLTVYVLDAPRELRRERVQQRNLEQGETFSMVVPPHIFELASDMWEPLDDAECNARNVRFVSTDG
jgi:predicted kinase